MLKKTADSIILPDFPERIFAKWKKTIFYKMYHSKPSCLSTRRKSMEIPASLKIFSIIYECRLWLIIPLAVVWSVFLSMQLYHRKRKAFFITLAALPLVILPIAVATTWSGWHYRMELRDRFAPNTNINQMPPAVHAEYARHDFHPRFRDVKAMILWKFLNKYLQSRKKTIFFRM